MTISKVFTWSSVIIETLRTTWEGTRKRTHFIQRWSVSKRALCLNHIGQNEKMSENDEVVGLDEEEEEESTISEFTDAIREMLSSIRVIDSQMETIVASYLTPSFKVTCGSWKGDIPMKMRSYVGLWSLMEAKEYDVPSQFEASMKLVMEVLCHYETNPKAMEYRAPKPIPSTQLEDILVDDWLVQWFRKMKIKDIYGLAMVTNFLDFQFLLHSACAIIDATRMG